MSALPGIEIKTSVNWCSRRDGHRAFLRQALREARSNEGDEILDLNRLPRPRQGSVSISHCQSLGGWAFDPSAPRIGFDLEVIARARPELVRRVSTEVELVQAPNAAALWTAKEAAYKWLPLELQPLTAKEIKIGAWVQTEEGYQFEASHAELKWQGFTWLVEPGVMASVCR